MAWQRAAEAWAAGEGLAVTAWAVDQRFEARGEWHVVEWNEDGARWEIRAPTQYVRVPAAPCSKSVKTSEKGDL
jgi:hypothetical protein